MSKPKKPPAPPAGPTAADLELVELPPGELVPNPKNYNKHPEDQLVMLAESVRKFGQPRPILVRKANRMIIGGHGICQTCIAAQLPTVKVLLWDCDQATADAFMIADNQHARHSKSDDDMLAALVRDLALEDGGHIALGFTDKELDKLLDRDAGGGGNAHFGAIEYQIVVKCRDETHQAELLEAFERDGLDCKALMT